MRQLSWRQRGELWLRLGIRLGLGLLGLLGLKWLLPPLLSLLAPFVAALIAATLLDPLVRWSQHQLGWSRRLLTLLILLLIFGLLGGGLCLLLYAGGSELSSLAQNWQGLLREARSAMEELENLLARVPALLPEQLRRWGEQLGQQLLTFLQGWAASAAAGMADGLKDMAMGMPAFFLALVMFVMGSYFITADYPYLRTRLMEPMGRETLALLGQIHATAAAAFGGYLRAQLLLSAGVFFILAAGFFVTGQSYALLLALGLALLDFIPLLGAGTVMVPWAVLCLFVHRYSRAISVMVIWGVVALFRRGAEPKILGNQTGLSPILSLVSIYLGMKTAGVLGMILGPILVLLLLNLAGLGMFRGLWGDLALAAGDVAAILRRSGEM